MAEYTDNLDFEPHNFNTTTVTLNGEHKVLALNSIEVARASNRWEIQTVASGVAMEVEKPATNGSIKFTFLEAGPTTDWLNAHINERITVDVSDSNAPNLNCSGKGRVMVHPPVKRGDMVDVPEWEIVIPYLKIKGGGYRLVVES